MTDEGKTELKIDCRIQGIPQAAARGIQRIGHLIKNLPDKSALIKDLQTICTCNPFSEK